MARAERALRRRADALCRALMREPRGHADMCGALLVPPVTAGADAGVLYFDAAGYPPISGHGLIAVATVALERRLFTRTAATSSGEMALLFDTVAGPLPVRVRLAGSSEALRVHAVTVSAPPAVVEAGGCVIDLGGRRCRVDLASAGLRFAIVDGEAVGVPAGAEAEFELRRLGARIAQALAASGPVAGVVFTGPAFDHEAHLRAVTVSATGAIDRSPGALAMPAIMAVLDAMSLLPEDGPFVLEGLAGGLHRGRVVRRTTVGDTAAIGVDVEGTAWITGEHTFLCGGDDPSCSRVGA